MEIDQQRSPPLPLHPFDQRFDGGVIGTVDQRDSLLQFGIVEPGAPQFTNPGQAARNQPQPAARTMARMARVP